MMSDEITQPQVIAQRIAEATNARCHAVFGNDPQYTQFMKNRPVVLYAPMSIGAVNAYLRDGWMLHGCSLGSSESGQFVMMVSGSGRYEITDDDIAIIQSVDALTDGLIVRTHLNFPERWCHKPGDKEEEREFGEFLVNKIRCLEAA